MAIPLIQTRTVAGFTCTGDKCPDTCCKGWGMQVSAEDVARYQAEAPSLLEAVTSGEAEFIMKRDEATDYCVKFDNGWCGIHSAYGDRMLGDACHFFPRATRSIGGLTVMSASLACPEIARLTLTSDAPCDGVNGEVERVPHSLKEYGLQDISGEALWRIHGVFLAHVRTPELEAERALAQVGSIVRSLMRQPVAQWEAALAFYMKSPDARLPDPEPDGTDPFHVLNALQGLIGAAPVSARPRLMRTVECMESVLQVRLDWDDLVMHMNDASAARYAQVKQYWHAHCAAHYAPILTRWLEGQLSLALFPFSGLGADMAERITIISVRFATVKLALMCSCFEAKALLAQDELVRVVQGIARFMDHLADPTLSLKIYEEVGWLRESRLRGLIGDM
jgi:hypothetical protein